MTAPIKLKSNLYTYGKFGKSLRETVDTDSGILYNHGKTKTKIKESDLTPDFVKIHCRDIWYMDGFLKTANVKHVAYSASHLNHLFKDDYLYISYDKQIKQNVENGITTYTGADIRISGNDIINVVNYIQLYGSTEIKSELLKVESEIWKKVEWYKNNYPDDYERIFHTKNMVNPFKSFCP